jgi:hypothetical protein
MFMHNARPPEPVYEPISSASAGRATIRAYESGDEHELVKLLGGPFNHDNGLEHWRWKFRHWPSTAANVWVGTAGGKAVFHYGGIPLRYSVNGSVTPVMLSADVMTAPAFRRQGLLTRGAGRAFAEWKEKGVAFTLGLPNERWGSRTTVLGVERLFQVRWLARPLRPEVLAARRLGLPWLRRFTGLSDIWNGVMRKRVRKYPEIELQEITRADDSFDELWQRRGAAYMFSAVRDSAWVQWRFLSSPSRKYDVVLARRGRDPLGYVATHVARSKDKTSAFLAELVGGGNTSVQETLLADAIERTSSAGADVLAALAVPGTASYAFLRRAGFLRGPSFGIHIVPFAENLPMGLVRKAENWHLTGADFDVI